MAQSSSEWLTTITTPTSINSNNNKNYNNKNIKTTSRISSEGLESSVFMHRLKEDDVAMGAP